MRYVITLILGLVTGAVIVVAVLFYNPFAQGASLSPLEVSDREQLVLNYSVVAADSILFTNDGESTTQPYPAKVLQLWEAPIRQTDALVTVMHDGRNEPAGLGIKFSSLSEQTRLLNGEALVNSVWYVFLPGRGSLLIEQSENHWAFLREVVVPAHWSSSDNWRGTWRGRITNGPGALGTALVHGGSGEFAGQQADAIETLSTTAYSAEIGPVAMSGQLTIEQALELQELPDP